MLTLCTALIYSSLIYKKTEGNSARKSCIKLKMSRKPRWKESVKKCLKCQWHFCQHCELLSPVKEYFFLEDMTFFFFFLLTRYTSDIWSSFIYWSTKSIQYSNRGVFSSCNLFRPRVWFWMPQLEPHSVHLKNSHHYHHFVTDRKQDLFCFKAHHYDLTLGVLPDLLLVMLKDIIVVPIHR